MIDRTKLYARLRKTTTTGSLSPAGEGRVQYARDLLDELADGDFDLAPPAAGDGSMRERLADAIGNADTHLGDCPREEWLIAADAVLESFGVQEGILFEDREAIKQQGIAKASELYPGTHPDMAQVLVETNRYHGFVDAVEWMLKQDFRPGGQ